MKEVNGERDNGSWKASASGTNEYTEMKRERERKTKLRQDIMNSLPRKTERQKVVQQVKITKRQNGHL